MTQNQQSEKTLITSIRYRPTSLATIAKYFRAQGLGTRSVGETLRLAYESFEQMIVNYDQQYRFNTEHDALHYLQACGINVNLAEKNKENLYKLLSLESANIAKEEEQMMELIRREMIRMGEIKPEKASQATIEEALSRAPKGQIVSNEEAGDIPTEPISGDLSREALLAIREREERLQKEQLKASLSAIPSGIKVMSESEES